MPDTILALVEPRSAFLQLGRHRSRTTMLALFAWGEESMKEGPANGSGRQQRQKVYRLIVWRDAGLGEDPAKGEVSLHAERLIPVAERAGKGSCFTGSQWGWGGEGLLCLTTG